MIDIPLEQAIAALNSLPPADFIVQVSRMAFKVKLPFLIKILGV
jgi:hypothetical protein